MTPSKIRVCVAGATGWVGSVLVKAILNSPEIELSSAIARKAAGQDVGTALGLPAAGIVIVDSLDSALQKPADVLVDYTKPDSVKARTMEALDRGLRVVIGTSGLTGADFTEIERQAKLKNLGVIAAGNFAISAALAKHFSLFAARHLPSWEILDYAQANKPDAPSGTARELAEEMATVAKNRLEVPIEKISGMKEARGASVAGTQVHSLRGPGFVFSFETIFGLPDERLSIRHDAGSGASPYVSGTLLAVREVMRVNGLIRGLDRLLFPPNGPV